MKKLYCITVFSGFLLLMFSCNQNKMEVKHATASKINQKNVMIVNKEDPICGMDVTENFSDTAVYKGKVYGFCSSVCKGEFKKEPQKYIKE